MTSRLTIKAAPSGWSMGKGSPLPYRPRRYRPLTGPSSNRSWRGKKSRKTMARVGKVKAECCRLPSGKSNFGPTTPVPLRSSSTLVILSNAPCLTTVSGLRRITYRPLLSRMAWLLLAAKPRFFELDSRRTRGKSSRSMPALPSADALSTTITSYSNPEPSPANTESRHPRSNSRVL
jgi:hypothetical protein